MGLALYPEANLERFNVEMGLGQQLLEPIALALQVLQARPLGGFHPAEPRPPFIERGIAETALAAQLRDRHIGFGLFQEFNDR